MQILQTCVGPDLDPSNPTEGNQSCALVLSGWLSEVSKLCPSASGGSQSKRNETRRDVLMHYKVF